MSEIAVVEPAQAIRIPDNAVGTFTINSTELGVVVPCKIVTVTSALRPAREVPPNNCSVAIPADGGWIIINKGPSELRVRWPVDQVQAERELVPSEKATFDGPGTLTILAPGKFIATEFTPNVQTQNISDPVQFMILEDRRYTVRNMGVVNIAVTWDDE